MQEGFVYIVQSSAVCDFRFKIVNKGWFSIVSFVFYA